MLDAPGLETSLLAVAFLCVAAIYSSVGHAGASGYLAVMALVDMAPERMKPTALALNILVASTATLNFWRAGVFYPRVVLAFAVTSVPLAFLGGAAHPDGSWYRPVLAAVLSFAGWRLLTRRPGLEAKTDRQPGAPLAAALPVGAIIGFLSGLTGTGGGIFLSPILVFFGWATVRQSAGISASFILVNSVAGLAGSTSATAIFRPDTWMLAIAAGIGGFAGSWLGANRLPERPLSLLLGLVLLVAAAKLAMT